MKSNWRVKPMSPTPTAQTPPQTPAPEALPSQEQAKDPQPPTQHTQASEESAHATALKHKVALHQGLMKVREYLQKTTHPSDHETPSEAERQRLTLTCQYVTQHALTVRAEAWNLYIQHFGTALNKTIKSVLYHHRGYAQEFESELLQNGLVQPFLTLLRKSNVLEVKILDAWLFSAARQATRKNLFLLRKDQTLVPLPIPGTEEDKGMGPELPSTQDGVPFDEDTMLTRLYDQQRSEALKQSLDMLSPAERTLIEQYFEQEWTLKEIGEVLVLNESTVLYRIRKVLQKLRQRLKIFEPEAPAHDKNKT